MRPVGPEAPPRADLAVVLARGDSRRMGRPKGLLRLPDDPRPFVARICALYAGWAQVVVVTGAETATAYAAALTGLPGVALCAAAGGEGTARTVMLGWRHRSGPATHVWAHPVDLPLVAAATVTGLREFSAAQPQEAVRPVVGGRPGHPVVVPAALLADLEREPRWQAGSFRAFLTERCRVGADPPWEPWTCADPGAVTDFDDEADLRDAAGRLGSGPAGPDSGGA